MWRPWLVVPVLRWLRSLFTGIQGLAARAARRSSASALRRFTLAQSAAALALVALTFALLVTRKLSLSLGTPAAESPGVTPFDAGAPRGQGSIDAGAREPALESQSPAKNQ
jgi:hypothetical protein